MALPITETLVLRVASSLAAGDWHYTRRQLYYAVCAEVEIPPGNAAATGQAGLGVLCLLLGLILLAVRPVGFVLLGAGVLLLIAGGVSRLRRPPRGRLLAMSYADFCTRFSGVSPAGLIEDGAAPPLDLPDGGADVAVMCDTNETAIMVAANARAAGLPVAAVEVVSPDATAAEAPPAVERGHQPSGADRAVVCLHDASPAGCAAVALLHERVPLVIDAGLRPRDLRTDEDEQLLEGAPARFSRDLSAVLTSDEVAWLASGRRVELATRTPGQVMAMLRIALAG